MSDNGMNMGHHGMHGKGNGSWPQNMFDTSVKVPCLISRPGAVPEGRVESALLSQYDWLPTALEYVGLQDRVPGGLPGSSFAPLLRGEDLGAKESIFVFDEYGPVRMVRSDEWKLVWRYPGGIHELYHLTEDPYEQTNLHQRGGYLEIIESMLGEMEEWYLQYVDPRIDGRALPVTGRGQLDRADADNAFSYRYPESWLRRPR